MFRLKNPNVLLAFRTSTLRLFADVSLLYRPVNTTDDDKRLQEDLTELLYT
jgi:hypothetical protein